MARTKGMLNLSGNLEVNAGAPLDARSVVPTVADLTVAANFQYKYVGMTVVVQATGDMYILTANDVTVAANWKQVGSGGGGSSYTAGDGIVIEDDEISTDNMPAADMSEIVTPKPAVSARRMKYSTEEQIVGEWVDGRLIYQRSFSITTPSSSGGIIVTNVDYYTNLDFILSYMLPNIDGGAGNLLLMTNCYSWTGNLYLNGSKKIVLEVNNASYLLGKTGILTIQYVKTVNA